MPESKSEGGPVFQVLYNLEVQMRFSDSLIIHKEKTKEIPTVTVVWIPELN